MALLRRIPFYKIQFLFYSGLPDDADTAPNGSLAFNTSSPTAPVYVRKSTTWVESTTGSTGVSSVFGRTGAISATAGDYTFAKISGVATIAQIASGTPDGTKFVRDDGVLAVPPGTGGASAATAAALGTVKISGTPTDALNPTAYVKEQTDTLLAGKAASTHTHAESDVTNLVSDLAGKASTVHTHAESDVTGLVADLAAKAPVSPSYVTLATDATLTNERVLTAGTGITLTDGGAGSTVTVTNKSWGLRTTANVALAASTTVNVTALDLTVANGEVYILDYFFPVTVSGGTVGLKPIFTLPAGSTGFFDAQGTTTAVTATSFTHSTTPTSASAVAFITASFTGFVYVRAVLTMGAAGTLRVGMTTGLSAAGNILAGSSLMVTKV